MGKKYKIFWTLESKVSVDRIIEYLEIKWSEKEVNDFFDLLIHFEKTISQFPKAFKESKRYKDCRLGLIHPYTTAIYKIRKDQIIIVAVFDNRSKPR